MSLKVAEMKDIQLHNGRVDAEKGASQAVEHNETLSSSESTSFDLKKLDYGHNGIKGLIQSPYVLGAAFLASLGGFSFGYGQCIRPKHQV